MALGVPNRKAKPILTLIPEEEKSISYRFTVVVVGKNAKEFVEAAVNSDMAEAYKPKSVQKKEAAEEEGAADAAADVPPAASPSLLSSNTATTTGTSQSVKEKKEQGDPADKLVLYTPAGTNMKELARIRLHPCVGFSDPMPLQRDPAAAKNTIVVLLFWQVKQGETDEVISDWYSRTAEINHMPQLMRPYTVVMGYETDGAQEQSLSQFAGKMNMVASEPRLIGDSSEDSITESLQDLADAAIVRLQNMELARRDSLAAASPGSSKCCTVS